MVRIFVVCVLALALSSYTAYASAAGRSYDGAVRCKAISLLAKNAGDAASKQALAAIEAEIQKKIAQGKTRAQADADVEYARFDYADTTSDPATFDSEWRKCLEVWGS